MGLVKVSDAPHSPAVLLEVTQGSKRRTRERVLVIRALVLWICFGFLISVL